MRARRGPCRHFFRRSQCRHGDGCKYSHTMPAVADLTSRRAQGNNTVLAPTRNKEEVCSYYLNGNCSYGEDCYFSHPKPPSSSASQHNFPSYNGTNGRQTNCAAYPTDCTLGCTDAIQYCHHFFKKGRCKFADLISHSVIRSRSKRIIVFTIIVASSFLSSAPLSASSVSQAYSRRGRSPSS